MPSTFAQLYLRQVAGPTPKSIVSRVVQNGGWPVLVQNAYWKTSITWTFARDVIFSCPHPPRSGLHVRLGSNPAYNPLNRDLQPRSHTVRPHLRAPTGKPMESLHLAKSPNTAIHLSVGNRSCLEPENGQHYGRIDLCKPWTLVCQHGGNMRNAMGHSNICRMLASPYCHRSGPAKLSKLPHVHITYIIYIYI